MNVTAVDGLQPPKAQVLHSSIVRSMHSIVLLEGESMTSPLESLQLQLCFSSAISGELEISLAMFFAAEARQQNYLH